MNRWKNLSQLWLLFLIHIKIIIREPGVLFWGILFPVLMALGLGVAFTKKADVTRKIAIISSSADLSEQNVDTLLFSFLEHNCEKNKTAGGDEWKWQYIMNDDKLGTSTFLFYEMHWQDAMVLLKKGSINIIVTASARKPEFHFDPMNSDAELTYLKLTDLINNSNRNILNDNSEVQPLTIIGARYIDFLIPGLIAMGVMMSCMWGISYGIIEKRSKKLLRRMVATPMKKSYFLIALISVRIIMNIVEAFILLLFALIAFKTEIQGSILALIVIFTAGNIAFSGIALLASSHTANTEVGNGIINFIVTPMMILSGIFFSYQNFPEWSLIFIKSLPLTMMTDGMRSVFNEGAGLVQVALQSLILTVTGIVTFAGALKIFKWS